MTVAFEASPEVEQAIEGLRAFVDAEVVKRHDEAGPLLSDQREVYQPDGRYTQFVLETIREIRMASADAGYYTMFVPDELGGGGLGSEALFRVWEDMHHRSGPQYWLAYVTVAHWTRGPSHVLLHATKKIREEVLPDLLSGSKSMCFAMSEADAGSDARNMKTRAVRDGDEWVINGSKQWITNGPYAEYAVVFAATSAEDSQNGTSGISAFIVPTDCPGLVVDNSIRMFGHVGGDEALIYLDGVRVGPEHVLGEVGNGFAIAMSGVLSGRLYNTARAVGLSRWAFDQAIDYVQRRTVFGKPLSSNQGLMFPLAESAMEIHAARLMGLNVARLLDLGLPCRKELSMAKAYATEMATRAIDRVVQTHGAMGFTNEMGLTEAWQSVRKACVADGTSEVLRNNIVSELLKGDLGF